MKLIVFLSVIALSAGAKIKSQHNPITQQNTDLFKYSPNDIYSLPQDIDDDSDKPPVIYNGDSKDAKISKLENYNTGRGQFKVSLKTENGIEVNQAGRLKDEKTFVISGSYTYTGADGKRYRVRYTADELGYHPITELDIDIPEPSSTANKLNGLGGGPNKLNGLGGGSNGLGGGSNGGGSNKFGGNSNGLGGGSNGGGSNKFGGNSNGLGGNSNGLGGGSNGLGGGPNALGDESGNGFQFLNRPLSSASNTVVHQKGQGYAFESGSGHGNAFGALGSASTNTPVSSGVHKAHGTSNGAHGSASFGTGSHGSSSFSGSNGNHGTKGSGSHGNSNGAHGSGSFGVASHGPSFGKGPSSNQGLLAPFGGSGVSVSGGSYSGSNGGKQTVAHKVTSFAQGNNNGAHGSASFGTGAHGAHGSSSFGTGAGNNNGAHGSASFGTGAHGAHGSSSFGTGAGNNNGAHGSSSFGTGAHGAHGSSSFGTGAGNNNGAHGSASFGTGAHGSSSFGTGNNAHGSSSFSTGAGSSVHGGSGVSVSGGSFSGNNGNHGVSGGFSSVSVSNGSGPHKSHSVNNGNKNVAASEHVHSVVQTENHDGNGYNYVPPTNQYLPPASAPVAHHQSADTYLPPLKK